MASPIIQNTFANTYKDDFRESDGYHRILFNPGRAVQSRELTQLQTIIQAELGRFGDNVFKDGGSVNPVNNVYVNNRYSFVKITATSFTAADIGTTFTGVTSAVKGKFIQTVDATGGDPSTAYIQYISGPGTTAEGSKFAAGETISNGAVTYTVQSINTAANPATGFGTLVSVGEGDFYTQGHFVFAEAQTLLLSKYLSEATGTIGFKITEQVVTAADDSRLYDNQGDVPNLTAPGADRYKITLALVDQANIAATDTFVFVVRVELGTVMDINNGRSEYALIQDLMAERTKEESGNYTVKPFFSFFEADSATTHLNLNVSDGVGYVDGYRVEARPQKIRVPKPVTTELVNNEAVSADYGSFVIVSTISGLDVDYINGKKFHLVISANTYANGAERGEARIRAIIKSGSNYKVYLYDIKMDSGYRFRDVTLIGTSATKVMPIVTEVVGGNNLAVLKESRSNNLLFQLPRSRPSSINASDYTYSVMKSGTETHSNKAIQITAGTGESFTSTDEWIFVCGAAVVVPSAIAIAGSTATVTFTANLSAATTIQFIYQVQKGGAGAPTPYKTKTLTNSTVTAAVGTEDGVQFVDLGKVDVLNVTRVRAIDSDGIDLSTKFYFDNGQRDGFYDHGRMVLAPGQTAPSGQIFVRFKNFAHSGTGDFFAVNSYAPGDISYGLIPSHRVTDGTVIPLRDVLDFRPSVDNVGILFSGTGGSKSEIPQTTDLITIDPTYFLPRKDKLVALSDGTISYVKGQGAREPSYPLTQSGAMDLYTFSLNANTLDETDLTSATFENRRYTMRDIGKLHRKINKVEEMATLSLLDIKAETLEVLDAGGLNRTKSGFLTDDFKDHRAANFDDLEYRASIDASEGILRPSYREKNVSLWFDSSDADISNTVLKGDEVLLDYTDVVWFSQPLASRTVKVNPFTIMKHEGILVLSPSSDESRSTITIRSDGRDEASIETFLQNTLGQADTASILNALGSNPEFGGRRDFLRNRINLTEANNFTSAGTLEEALQSLPPAVNQILPGVFDTISPNWREFQWGWAGIERSNGEERLTNSEAQTNNGTTFGRFATRLFVPRIRAREIRFRASGLLANTRHWPYFDGVDVSDHVAQNSRIGATFPTNWQWGNRRTGWTSAGFANRIFRRNFNANWNPVFGNASPTDSQRALISDANGLIEGTFFIPNNATQWFLSGTRTLKIVDVPTGNEANAISYCSTDYLAEGVTDTRFRRPPPPPPPPPAAPRQPRAQNRDPIAQTFLVERSTGVFITKVGIYFNQKDTAGIPVQVFLTSVENGYPRADHYYKGAIATLSPDQVSISNDASAVTYFEFDNPVYLEGASNRYHALVVKSPSIEYTAFAARVGDFVLGSNDKKITKQPDVGSFFRSQNGATWEPAQWIDLKFDLNRAEFETSGTAIFKNDFIEPKLLVPNPLLFDSGDATVRVIHPNHGLQINDIVSFQGIDSAAAYPMSVNALTGNRTITAIDGSGYTFEADTAATSSLRSGGLGIYVPDNVVMDTVYPSIEITAPPGTNVTLEGSFTSSKSLAGSETFYQKESTYSHSLKEYEAYNFTAPKVMMSELLETAGGIYPVTSAEVKATFTTTSSYSSPIISAERCSLTAISNLIDKQESTATAGYNVPLSYIAETDAIGGTSLAKYVTKPVTLEEDAVGIKVILAANRPSVTNFDIYFKAINDDVDILETPWTKATLDSPVQSDENINVFREYRYTIGTSAGTLAPFVTFQIKIVMESTNSSKVPVFRDFRAIALSV